MSYRNNAKKALAFKIVYLFATLAVLGYSTYILISEIAGAIRDGVSFDMGIIMIATLVAVLFQGAIVGFIVRSFNAPTILMKNLVFKNDGTPYIVGVVSTLVGAVISLGLAITFLVSAYAKPLIHMSEISQQFVSAVFLMMFVQLSFCDIYFLTFRHESGSFAII